MTTWRQSRGASSSLDTTAAASLYVLKYGTRNGGWLVPRISEPHITPADKLRLYDDNGMDAYYEVDPTPGATAWSI